MTDIEIARNANLKPISEVAKTLGLTEDELEYYGKYKAKVDFTKITKAPKAKVVLVTAINPTAAGEGKTTVSIGLHDALCKLKINSVLALREPSLGPVFGIKGGATGGGYAQVAPMEDINLHFTGDFHAITSANNLLCAMIDNHIFQGNELNIDKDKIIFNRAMDLNDRALREITVRSTATGKETIERSDKFNITAASEIMAILALSKDINELKENLGDITVAYNMEGSPVYARDLNAHEAMTILLKDAIKPNLVQTLENNPVLIHCGPFANIAHGCNSIIATDLARRLGDIVVTEAGFGADLGAEKFLDVKCRKMGIAPSCVVVVATIRALKLHGGASLEDIKRHDLGLSTLRHGLNNLKKHLNNITKVYNLPVVVALNHFTDDTKEELLVVKNMVDKLEIPISLTNVWSDGGLGAIGLASEVIKKLSNDDNFKYCYNEKDSIEEKIEKIAKKIYGAKHVIYLDKAKEAIEKINELGKSNYPVVIAKTQYSLSDDPKKLYINEPFDITIRDIELRTGAKMIVALAGNMLLMPGLPKEPAAVKMTINDDIIDGLF